MKLRVVISPIVTVAQVLLRTTKQVASFHFSAGVHATKSREGACRVVQESAVHDTYLSRLKSTTPDDDLALVKHYTCLAIDERGTTVGLDALTAISRLCKRRIPYQFLTEESNKVSGTVISRCPKLLPQSLVPAVLEQVRRMEDNGWFGTNPDSVDGLPSLHLNLISGGKPTASAETGDLKDLLELVKPQLYDVLLPEVNRLLNTTEISVSEVFIRRYGQDVGGGVTRNGISAHYDVFSRVTSVIALDDVAATGTNGLYTSYISHLPLEPSQSAQSTVGSTVGSTSNHAALRRFFPLDSGDAIIHTWDVLHGVDVEPGLDRTSLIVWFTDGNEDPTRCPAWLTDHQELETNNVVQFVLGSALASLEQPGPDDEHEASKEQSEREQRLYLKSAMDGNSFAWTRLGSLFEEGSVSQELRRATQASMEQMQPPLEIPQPIQSIQCDSDEGMAIRCWLEGARRGNPLAQRALADELMFLASQSGDSDSRLLSSVLFALAAQQGCTESLESLSRVVEFDLASRGVNSEEDFLASPVVMTAKASMSS